MRAEPMADGSNGSRMKTAHTAGEFLDIHPHDGQMTLGRLWEATGCGLLTTVRLFDFILFQTLFGMGYMFMDSFIRQYTRRVDGYKYLNPLLRGIGYGQMLQSAMGAIIVTTGTADALRILAGVVKKELPWTVCPPDINTNSCVSVSTIIDRCNQARRTSLNVTSTEVYYRNTFVVMDRNAVSTRTFIMGVIWMCNFVIATLTDDNILKVFQLIFVFRTFTTLVVAMVLLLYLRHLATEAFSELVIFNFNWSFSAAMSQMSYVYGIGFLSFYDFGAVSPYTMIDTAIVIGSMYFTIFAFIRSWIFKIIYLNVIKCVKIYRDRNPHFIFFALFPLGSEFVRAQKLYLYYLYLNIVMSSFGYTVMMTITIAKVLHAEFRSVKIVYFLGVLCCIGFCSSIPIAFLVTTNKQMHSVVHSINWVLFYLGCLKMILVMWMYGLERFSTDINFWLGFKPTKFWKLSWALTPIMILISIIQLTLEILRPHLEDKNEFTYIWIGISIVVAIFFKAKTVIKFLVRNNLAGIFSPSIKYGPPEPSDRRNRRNYSETIALRRCKHNCQVIDDLFDCNHMPIIFRTFSLQSEPSSTISLMAAYQSEKRNMDSATDLLNVQSKGQK